MRDEDIVKLLHSRYEYLNQRKSNWQNVWQECSDYVHPNRGDFSTKRWYGEKRTQLIFDATAPWALGQFAAGLHGFLTSPTQRWFTLTPKIQDWDDNLDLRYWLEETTEVLYEGIFNAPSSRWLQQSHEAYLDLGAFGNTCVFVNDVVGKPITFSTFHMGECVFAENEEGYVDTMFREYVRTAAQLEERFGYDSLPKELQDDIAKNPYKEHTVVQAIYPRKDWDPVSLAPERRRYATAFFMKKPLWIFPVSGYYEVPFAAARWYKSSGEWYGRGPAMDSLPDIKMVNDMMKTVIKGAQKFVDPPLQMPDEGFIMPINLTPSSINYYRAGSKDRIEPILAPNSARPDLGLEMIDNRRQQIIRAFFADWMQLKEGPQMTATEVLQRQEDRMRLIGPMVGRMQSEFLGPIIQRVFAIAIRRGMVEPPPVDLREVGGLRIEYTSPVVQAQKNVRLFTLTRLFESIAPLAQVKPEILDNMDGDGVFKWMHHLLDAPMEALMRPEQVRQIRADRAQQQATMAEAEALRNAGAGMKSLMSASAGT